MHMVLGKNYVDRKDACPVGRYTLDANDTGKYVKPQSMGNREGLRSMDLKDASGKGIRIQTQGNVSFSALRYTDEDLMNTNILGIATASIRSASPGCSFAWNRKC